MSRALDDFPGKVTIIQRCAYSEDVWMFGRVGAETSPRRGWAPLFEHWWFLGHGSRRRWGCWGFPGAGSGELLRLRGTHGQGSFS